MKKPLILTIFWGIITILNAQIPNGFSYQAVVRNSDQMLLKNQEVTIKATILRNEEALFEQTQTATTNENGLLTIVIGNESFQDIDWLQGTLFIKTQIDPTGGNNYIIETETQLLALPFAMAAKIAETALTVQDMDILTNRVDNLENQIEELYLHLGIPIDVPYELYSLNGTMCKWVEIENDWWKKDYDYPSEVMIINSNEEMENFIICENDTFPEIDFSKHSLLLVRGSIHNLVLNVSVISLKKLSLFYYELIIEILLDGCHAEDPWFVSLILKKISEYNKINLVITTNYFY